MNRIDIFLIIMISIVLIRAVIKCIQIKKNGSHCGGNCQCCNQCPTHKNN